MTDVPVRLLTDWGIHEPVRVRRPESGTMNETWLLEWPSGHAVLRRHRRFVRADIELEHRVLGHAHSRGIPCPRIIPTRQGNPLVEDDGRFYSLYTWAPGCQVRRGQLDAGKARSMGSMLGRIHLALADLPGGPEAHDPISPVRHTLRRIEQLLKLARDRPDQDRVRGVIDQLTARSRWLSTQGDLLPPHTSAGTQVIHGDYHDTNVFFEHGRVSCVIDWDKARREIPARELVRAMDYALGMEPVLCDRFVTGYRAIVPLPPEQLDEAAAWWSYHETQSLWAMEQLLLEDNDRVAGLLDKPFTPFWRLWTAAAIT